MSVSSCSNCSLSAILTDNEVRARVLNNDNVAISISSDELDGILTDTETKTSVLTQYGITLSPESLRSNSNQDTQWWKTRTWRATSLETESETIEEVSEPSSLFADTGSSCGSDADRLPSVFTPSTFCGSSCGSHLTSISQVLEKSNSGLGSLGEVSTTSQRKRKYNTTKNGRRAEKLVRDNRSVKRRLIVATDEITRVLSSPCCSRNCLQELIVFADLNNIRRSVESMTNNQVNQVVMQCIGTGLNQALDKGRHIFPLPNGKSVCSHALPLIYGISLRSFRRLTTKVKNGLFTTMRLPRTCSTNSWKTYIVPFLIDYAKDYGAMMPHSKKSN